MEITEQHELLTRLGCNAPPGCLLGIPLLADQLLGIMPVSAQRATAAANVASITQVH